MNLSDFKSNLTGDKKSKLVSILPEDFWSKMVNAIQEAVTLGFKASLVRHAIITEAEAETTNPTIFRVPKEKRSLIFEVMTSVETRNPEEGERIIPHTTLKGIATTMSGTIKHDEGKRGINHFLDPQKVPDEGKRGINHLGYFFLDPQKVPMETINTLSENKKKWILKMIAHLFNDELVDQKKHR
jgi:hypothetical protein